MTATVEHDSVGCPAPTAWGSAINHLLDVVGDQARVAVSISGTCPVCGRYDLARLIVNEGNRPDISFTPIKVAE